MEFPTQLQPDETTRAGRMLAAGDIRVTVTDMDSGDHVTVRYKSMKDNRENEGKNWIRVPFAEASHVFIEVPNASGEWPDKVGTFYPRTGKFFPDAQADPYRVWCAQAGAWWLAEGTEQAHNEVRFQEESYCGTCGKTLTDPESIDRGIGPDCLKKATGSHHQVKQRAQTRLDVESATATACVNCDHKISSREAAYCEACGCPLNDSDERTMWTGSGSDRVAAILKAITDLTEKQVAKIRRELEMWTTSERSTLFDN